MRNATLTLEYDANLVLGDDRVRIEVVVDDGSVVVIGLDPDTFALALTGSRHVGCSVVVLRREVVDGNRDEHEEPS
jgi:hypothetical protein